ncbi:MAG TPA: SLBB domain-containing protein [Ignavibacteriaceae bacterium]|nr:SLBB domain-containing protein [Ignavibacteriaceae bacterium]
MKNTFFAFFFLLILSLPAFAQNSDVQIGSSMNQLRIPSAGGFFDYSDPSTVNIKVAVWGFVKYPGKYIIPSYSNVNDLLSYAGGPEDAARLQEMRIIRTNADSSQTIIPLDYKDILFNLNVKNNPQAPLLHAGDVLMVTGEPRLYFKDYLSIGLSVVSTLISIATLVVLVVRK